MSMVGGEMPLLQGADPRLALLNEMKEQNFDLIRFASYRTACKLRHVQRKCNLHIIDIWNVIEAFRENALNTLEATSSVNVSRLEALISSFYHNLNKRLPPSQQVNSESCSALLLNWLLSAYTVGDNVGKIKVFSIKVALATMCAGKLMDKLRYIFSLLSDGNGHLMLKRLADYLREVLALPAAVYESPSFSYNDGLPSTIFTGGGKITVNDFLDVMMSDPGPPCLVWLPLLHRLASVESVVHPLPCSACRRGSLSGFRYRCVRCSGYTLCQDCFWRGRVSGHHTNEHEVKEYTTYKSPSKQIGHTLRKSFRCVPERARINLPKYPDQPERTLNLSHIVPPSPVPMHNGFPDAYNYGPGGYHAGYVNTGSLDSRSSRSAHRNLDSGSRSMDAGRISTDDEHRLIARYAARLAHENRTMGRTPSETSLGMDSSRVQRELISQLEAKNREIMREIARLRQQELENVGLCSEGSGSGPPLVSELRALRQRKGELEEHLASLQESRRHLMGQLEGLMKMLKNHQSSPRSTPNSSPRSTKSPPLLGTQRDSGTTASGGARSAPQTPSLGGDRDRDRMDMSAMSHSLGAAHAGFENMPVDPRSQYNSIPRNNTDGDEAPSREEFEDEEDQEHHQAHEGGGGGLLRADLLYAADSVTNAMSTLVRELNSDGAAETSKNANQTLTKNFEEDADDEDIDEDFPPRPRQLPQSLLQSKVR